MDSEIRFVHAPYSLDYGMQAIKCDAPRDYTQTQQSSPGVTVPGTATANNAACLPPFPSSHLPPDTSVPSPSYDGTIFASQFQHQPQSSPLDNPSSRGQLPISPFPTSFDPARAVNYVDTPYPQPTQTRQGSLGPAPSSLPIQTDPLVRTFGGLGFQSDPVVTERTSGFGGVDVPLGHQPRWSANILTGGDVRSTSLASTYAPSFSSSSSFSSDIVSAAARPSLPYIMVTPATAAPSPALRSQVSRPPAHHQHQPQPSPAQLIGASPSNPIVVNPFASACSSARSGVGELIAPLVPTAITSSAPSLLDHPAFQQRMLAPSRLTSTPSVSQRPSEPNESLSIHQLLVQPLLPSSADPTHTDPHSHTHHPHFQGSMLMPPSTSSCSSFPTSTSASTGLPISATSSSSYHGFGVGQVPSSVSFSGLLMRPRGSSMLFPGSVSGSSVGHPSAASQHSPSMEGFFPLTDSQPAVRVQAVPSLPAALSFPPPEPVSIRVYPHQQQPTFSSCPPSSPALPLPPTFQQPIGSGANLPVPAHAPISAANINLPQAPTSSAPAPAPQQQPQQPQQRYQHCTCRNGSGWKRLRLKKDVRYYLCRFCGAKWKVYRQGHPSAGTTSTSPDSLPSDPSSPSNPVCSTGGPSAAALTDELHLPLNSEAEMDEFSE